MILMNNKPLHHLSKLPRIRVPQTPYLVIFSASFGVLSALWFYLSREEVLQVENGRHTDHQTDPQQDHIDDPELEKKKINNDRLYIPFFTIKSQAKTIKNRFFVLVTVNRYNI